jgi:hypothetical protein
MESGFNTLNRVAAYFWLVLVKYNSAKNAIVWDVTPCNPVKSTDVSEDVPPPSSVSKISQGINVETCFLLVSRLAYTSTMKMETVYYFEASVDITGLHGVIVTTVKNSNS